MTVGESDWSVACHPHDHKRPTHQISLAPTTVRLLLGNQKFASPTNIVAVLVGLSNTCQGFQAKPRGISEADGPAAVPTAVFSLGTLHVLDTAIEAGS